MAAGSTLFYDRGNIILMGVPYLQDGYITEFRCESNYNTTLQQGFSNDGSATGATEGNEEHTISWNELFLPSTMFVDTEALIRNNPAARTGQLIFQPLTIGSGTPSAPAIVFTGLYLTRCSNEVPGQGQSAKRSISLVVTKKNMLI